MMEEADFVHVHMGKSTERQESKKNKQEEEIISKIKQSHCDAERNKAANGLSASCQLCALTTYHSLTLTLTP